MTAETTVWICVALTLGALLADIVSVRAAKARTLASLEENQP